MGWESFDVVRFDLELKRGHPKLKVLITRLLLVLKDGMVNQLIGNRGLGIF